MSIVSKDFINHTFIVKINKILIDTIQHSLSIYVYLDRRITNIRSQLF